MQMVDQNEEDDKIIAIHENDPAVAHYHDISMLPTHTLEELQRFFEDYKILERKKVRIERFKGRIDAQEVIRNSMRLYQDSFAADGSKRADAPVLASELRDDTPAAMRGPSRNARTDAARRAAARLEAHDHDLEELAAVRTAESAPADGEAVPPAQSQWPIDSRTLGAFGPPTQMHAPGALPGGPIRPTADDGSASG
jgi:hypothetical protein